MSNYWKRSRVTKALVDGKRVGSFAEAEARLNAVRLDVIVGGDQMATAAGQAALLTAVATAHKCFGRVTVVAGGDAALIRPLPLGKTLMQAARRLGARVVDAPRKDVTHTICIGTGGPQRGWAVRCWWDRWFAGTRTFGGDAPGDSRLPLAGVYAAALAVRQVFAWVLTGAGPPRDASISLWTPWEPVDFLSRGPQTFDGPDKVWLLGLGHLGQAFAWNLCFLPFAGERLAVLQDDQTIGEENEATSILVLPNEGRSGKRKTRIAALWLEACGWRTELIERRHVGDIALKEEDPPYLLSGLDRLEPRFTLARHGFPFMLDAGLGHGPGDFEGIQLRTVVDGAPVEGLWGQPEDGAGKVERLLQKEGYVDLAQHVGGCGTVAFAEASVAVPFVGAATGALVIGQLIRLSSLEASPLLMQMELGAPECVTSAGLVAAPKVNLGATSIRL